MGKDEKEDTGFGFKDKAKAEETLKLLEAHDAGYRRLTVRGLLGRAKRVLSLTKAEDKLRNIKEAMEVFENWLAEVEGNKEKKPEKEKKAKKEEKSGGSEEAGKEEKEDKGFGFKDKAKAEETLKLLEAHDAGYRRLTVRGLLGRAKRVLSLTKAEDKIKNIKEAMEVFENWLAEVDSNKEKKPEKKKSKKEDSSSGSEAEEKDKTTKDMKELKLKESKKSEDMEHDGDDTQDGGAKNKDGGDKSKDGDKKDRKRRSSARSDDESQSKKKK